jgi:lambda family phage minor tail protein L
LVDAFKLAVQKFTPGNRVELFDVDLNPIGSNTILRYFPSVDEAQANGHVTWRTHNYLPMPIELTGLDVSGRGTLPRPKVTMSNIIGEFNTLEATYGRFEGVKVTRWVTYDVYLDASPDADPNAYFPVDVFYVDRVSKRDDVMVELELRTAVDVGGKLLPGRQVLRNTCTHTYRRWVSGTTFDYTRATCPYVGTDYFDDAGNVVVAQFDKCSKALDSGCRMRFGTAPLPTRAFPGVRSY